MALVLRLSNGLMPLFLISKANRERLNSFYQKYSSYYNKLNEEQKRRFIYRANNLTQSIKFIGRQGFVVDEKVKLIVVSAIVQITFGFNQFHIPKFKTIFIYPDSYKNPFTGKMHDGEVNPRGLIILSWEKLVKGFADPNDKINLGLHEMAHAFMQTINKHQWPYDYDFIQILKSIVSIAQEEIGRINDGSNLILRRYAAASPDEFFAVAVEHFFEAPKELATEMPRLYERMKALFRQDPAKDIFTIKSNYYNK
jgi:hypothetical protein